jgi:hypothetical protein
MDSGAAASPVIRERCYWEIIANHQLLCLHNPPGLLPQDAAELLSIVALVPLAHGRTIAL